MHFETVNDPRPKKWSCKAILCVCIYIYIYTYLFILFIYFIYLFLDFWSEWLNIELTSYCIKMSLDTPQVV